MKLKTMMFFVSDISEAEHFYCDILGFLLKTKTDNSIAFVHEGCDFIAFKCEKNAVVEDYSNVARSVFVFEVASIDKTFDDLCAKGVKFLHKKPSENDFSRYAAFQDPFGNIHEISESKKDA